MKAASPIPGSGWITGSVCSNSGNDGRVTSPKHPEMAPVLIRGADFRFDPISGKAEAASGPAQFGSTLDDFGERYIAQNTVHIRHVVVPMRYLARAPLLQVGAESQDVSDHDDPNERSSARMYPLTGPQEWRKQRTQIRQQRYNENDLHIHEALSGWFTAATGSTLYNGDAFPKEYVGDVFTGDVSANLVHRDIIRPSGATLVAHRAKEGVEFLASTDVWFRPCNFMNAPDGNLYFTDIYRQVIETPESIPEEIRKNINFYNGDTLGRIYRIVPNHPLRHGRSEAEPRRARFGGPGEAAGELEWLARVTAQRLLLERQDRSVIPDLRAMALVRADARGARACAVAAAGAFRAGAGGRGARAEGCGFARSGACGAAERTVLEPSRSRWRMRCWRWSTIPILTFSFRRR